MNNEFVDIRKLEAFAAVISLESVTGAARLLGKSQPVVTRLIQDLESELGFSLFQRNGPKLIPTEKGLAFSRDVERFLVGLRLIRDRAKAIGEAAPRTIEIAATQTFAAGLIPRALAQFDERQMPNKVYVEATLPEHVRQSVLSGTADFGLVSLPISFSGLDVRSIAEMPCVAAISASDPLASLDVIPVDAFASRRLISMADPFRMRRIVDAKLRQNGVTPPAVVEVNTSITALTAARSGMGIAIIEASTGYGVPVEGVVIRPLDIQIPYFWALIAPANATPTPLVEELMEQVKVIAAEILPGLTFHDPASREALMDAIYGDIEGSEAEARRNG